MGESDEDCPDLVDEDCPDLVDEDCPDLVELPDDPGMTCHRVS